MPRRTRGVMSDALKYDLARELGVYDTVATEGWGSVSARNCGNLVKLAVARAEAALAAEHTARRTAARTAAVASPATGVSPGPTRAFHAPEVYRTGEAARPAYSRAVPAGPFPYWAVQTGTAQEELRT